MEKAVNVNGKAYVVSTVPEDRPKRVRVHVWSDVNDQLLPVPTEAEFGCNVHTLRGVNAALDAAWDKHNRSWIKAKRAVMEAVFNALTTEERAELGVAHGGLTFSRKAGCTCGCSPGFMSTVRRCHFVSISDAPTPAPYAGENI